MIKATLVTPLPPQPTGLADYAKRILAITESHVNWTVAYPSLAVPIEGYNCVPISELKGEDLNGTVVYQVGNSPHCEEVNGVMLTNGGIGLFHETNLHHSLRNTAHRTGNWESYREHVVHDYGEKADEFLKAMGKKAESLSEYDRRLRANPLVGRLVSACSVIAVLSDTARGEMERLAPGKKVVKLGFLPDFMERVRKPEKRDSEPVIGVAGSFHYGRSWEEIVRAVEMLRRTVDCRLLVAGGGWPETAFPWVEVTGRLPDAEFRRQIGKFDIAIDLRHHTCGETSSSLMDILGSGIPAVVTAEGTFRDIPADAVLRIPSQSGASGAYAALEYLVRNEELRRSISIAAEKYFADVTDREKCLAQWIELLSGGRE
jgi:glycosyltransferase involved in cell wall biosynthesis